MIKNLLIIALRSFKKDKWYSLLNVLGLTIVITAATTACSISKSCIDETCKNFKD